MGGVNNREICEVALKILGRVAELRDRETEFHLERVALIVERIARELQKTEVYGRKLNEDYIRCLKTASSFHDIGKIAVPDSILLKPAPLSCKEFEIMKQHTIVGGEILKEAQNIVSDSEVFDAAVHIALYHHEKWDGSGYPEGLCGQEIPLSARIMAVADVYDALVSTRPYKAPIPHEDALGILESGRGRYFDPDIVDIILKKPRILKVRTKILIHPV